jgi:hypothetical protein
MKWDSVVGVWSEVTINLDTMERPITWGSTVDVTGATHSLLLPASRRKIIIGDGIERAQYTLTTRVLQVFSFTIINILSLSI